MPQKSNDRAFSRAAPTARLRVGILLANNFTLSALSLFLDTLRLAADESDWSRPIHCSWAVMTPRAEPISSSCGLQFARTSGFSEPRDFDYVAVVGGLLHIGDQIDPESVAYLGRCDAAGVPLIGLCTGSFILSRAGLMRGRRCCVSWFHHDDFVAEFRDLEPDADQLFIEDGDRITCAGDGGVADLAAHLVRRHVGASAAQKALHILQLDHARQGHDAQPHGCYVDGVPAPLDVRIRRSIFLMGQHVSDPIAVDDIAARLGISVRQFERLCRSGTGSSPSTLYRRIRLSHARHLLEGTKKTITEIGVETGFCDGAHFAQAYKAAFGHTPREARRMAGALPPI